MQIRVANPSLPNILTLCQPSGGDSSTITNNVYGAFGIGTLQVMTCPGLEAHLHPEMQPAKCCDAVAPWNLPPAGPFTQLECWHIAVTASDSVACNCGHTHLPCNPWANCCLSCFAMCHMRAGHVACFGHIHGDTAGHWWLGRCDVGWSIPGR